MVVDDVDSLYSEFVIQEWRETLMFAAHTTVDWLTPPHVLQRSEVKGYQLAVANSLGLRIPKTIVTSDARRARRFVRDHGRVVVKPIRYGLVSNDPPRVAFTTEVGPEQLRDLGGVPVILQELMEASTHLRVVTVERAAFVAALTTEDLDWRLKTENHQRFVVADGAHPRVADDALRVASALGLGYSSQDWIVSRSGESVFLEANPNGQWLFLDDTYNGRITEALARALTRTR